MNEGEGAGEPRGLRIIIDPTRESGPWWLPVVSVLLAFLFCGLFIALNGINPFMVYGKMIQGAFGSGYGISETIVKAIPLLLCEIGLSLAYRIAFWNIGAEGQFLVGAMAATAVTVYLPHLPGPAYIPLMLIAGAVAGAGWGLLTAVLRVYFQVNELISSLMLNDVAVLLLDYFVFGPWKDPAGFNFPGTAIFAPSQQLLTFGGSRVHLGLLYGLAALGLYGFFIHYTRWGYEWRVLGANPSVARYAGIRIERHILLVMLLSGGLAGVAGMSEVSGVTMMLVGTVTASLVSVHTDQMFLALFCAMIASALLGVLHGILCVTLRANQIVSGLAMTLFASR